MYDYDFWQSGFWQSNFWADGFWPTASSSGGGYHATPYKKRIDRFRDDKDLLEILTMIARFLN
ncbi:MAG: hypothetical protein ABIH23_15655 [bacterium]